MQRGQTFCITLVYNLSPLLHQQIDSFFDLWDKELDDFAYLELFFNMLELILVSMASYGYILASWLMYNYGAQERRLSAITSQPGLPLAMDQSMGNLYYSKHELIQVVACILLFWGNSPILGLGRNGQVALE